MSPHSELHHEAQLTDLMRRFHDSFEHEWARFAFVSQGQ